MKALRGETDSNPIMTPAANLGREILTSMKHVEVTLLFAFEHTAGALGPKPSEKETSTQVLHRLDRARDAARGVFALNRDTNEDTPKIENVGISSDASDQFVFLVSLMEVSTYSTFRKNISNVNTCCSDGQRSAPGLACRR